MNRKDLWDALDQIDDDLLAEASRPRRKRPAWRRWGALAACFVLVVTGIWTWERGRGEANQASDSAPYAITAENVERDIPEIAPEIMPEKTEEGENVMNQFAYLTGQYLLEGTENGLYSPISLYYALGMAAAGAAGDTQAQLLELLGTNSVDTLLQQCQVTPQEQEQLQIANSIWVDDTLGALSETYTQQVESSFGATVFSVDFRLPETAEQMRRWVAEQTAGLVEYTPSDPSGPLNLLNTVYFKSQWQAPFSEANTQEDVFTLSDGQEIRHEFMNGDLEGVLYQGDGYRRGELPLENGSMVFILPEEGGSLQSLLAEKGWQSLLCEGEGETARIQWHIPKFGWDDSWQGTDLLRKLGADLAVTPDADFSGITGEDSGLYISDITQKTHIEVDEYGVEAAAYTKIAMKMSAYVPAEESMDLNRPFLYAICDEAGNILFMGVCANPEG